MTKQGLTADLSRSIATIIYQSGFYAVHGCFDISKEEFECALNKFLSGDKRAFEILRKKQESL